MGFMRDVEIVWDDLLDAFDNPGNDLFYFLDRETGEIFAVPVDYDDDEFWQDMEESGERFLKIPPFDYEQERLLLHEFIQRLENEGLKSMLERSYGGKKPYGRLDEILSFYPEEFERFMTLKEELISNRVRQWLEENDLFAVEDDDEF